MITIDPTIFKAYDIRGFYPSQITKENSYIIARAICEFVKPKTVVIGKDVRVGSNSVYKTFIEGFLDSGVNVDYLGEVTSDSVYFAVGKYNYDLGIAITGSHNPKEYTGFKLTKKGVVPISGDSGMNEIRALAIKGEFVKVENRGQYKEIDLTEEYINQVFSFINKTTIKPLKIALDTGNGVAGPIILDILSKLPVEVFSIYTQKDGNFPNHLPDPLKEENLVDLKALVVKNKCDIGVAFDGDGDRVFFVDENGNSSNGYFITAFLSKVMLIKNPGASIVHEPRLTWAILDTIKEFGGVPEISKAGHSLIKETMRRTNSAFGGETSGHFYYRDYYYADNGVISMLLVLELMSKENRKFSDMLKDYFDKYFFSGEINNIVSNPDQTISQIKANYSNSGYLLDETDGITVENGREWRFNVRKSNTEPLVRLNVEAKSKEIVDVMTKEVLHLIQN